jgi:energy-converting hydrogenase Eha subunit A
MNSDNQVRSGPGLFSLRPRFVAACAAFILILVLPWEIRNSLALQRGFLIAAAMAILVGWVLLLMDRPQRASWRTMAAAITSVYLVASLPVFVFEMSQDRWFMRHPWHWWFEIYARPWVHWGYIFVYLSVIGSFLGRGRSRVAFVTGALLLMVVWEAMGIWVY